MGASAPGRLRKIEDTPGVRDGKVQGTEAAPFPFVSNTSPYYIIPLRAHAVGKNVC